MSTVEVGQVITLKIRFNNQGVTSSRPHPYLVVARNNELGTIEIAQLDSLAGKEFKAAKKSNKTIFCDNPQETVIDKDSYIQLDNTFLIEDCIELETRFRRQTDKLSSEKLEDVLNAYQKYHDTHEIDENKIVYMDRNEILTLNGEN